MTTLAGAAGTQGLANGVGTAAIFHRPVGVAMDALGTVAVVADTYNHLIRRITISSGAVVTLAGQGGVTGISNGLGTVATFYNPFGISYLDAAGGVAVVVSCRASLCVHGCDTVNSRVFLLLQSQAERGSYTIRQVEVLTGAVITLAGTALTAGTTNGVGTNAQFYGPCDSTFVGRDLVLVVSAHG